MDKKDKILGWLKAYKSLFFVLGVALLFRLLDIFVW